MRDDEAVNWVLQELFEHGRLPRTSALSHTNDDFYEVVDGLAGHQGLLLQRDDFIFPQPRGLAIADPAFRGRIVAWVDGSRACLEKLQRQEPERDWSTPEIAHECGLTGVAAGVAILYRVSFLQGCRNVGEWSEETGFPGRVALAQNVRRPRETLADLIRRCTVLPGGVSAELAGKEADRLRHAIDTLNKLEPLVEQAVRNRGSVSPQTISGLLADLPDAPPPPTLDELRGASRESVLAEYRRRLLRRRRSASRHDVELLTECIEATLDDLHDLTGIRRKGDPVVSVKGPAWERLEGFVNQLASALGTWHYFGENLSRHLGFAQSVDYIDIVETDWPASREKLRALDYEMVEQSSARIPASLMSAAAKSAAGADGGDAATTTAKAQRKARFREKPPLSVPEAIGKAHVLAVGVSEYDPSSNFTRLRQCVHDAQRVAACFRDKRELHSAPELVDELTSASEGATRPSRGNIIRHLRALASRATSDDRIVFYFSGHGQRLDDQLYLVPEDAWIHDNPGALVSIADVNEVLSASQAKVKIVVLDACSTGPTLSDLKHPASQLSEKFLADYIRKSEGVVLLASSLSDQSSSTKSPDSKLSLFTHFVVKALEGELEALDPNGLLTAESLFAYASTHVQRVSKSHHRPQQPAIKLTSSGVLILGDYRGQRSMSPVSEKPRDDFIVAADSRNDATRSVAENGRIQGAGSDIAKQALRRDSNLRPSADDTFWESTLETLVERLQLKQWRWFIDNAVRNLVHKDFFVAADELAAFSLAAVWPSEPTALVAATKALLSSFDQWISFYRKNVELKPSGEHYGPDASFRREGFNPRFELFVEYQSRWEQRCYWLLCKYIVCLNDFCGEVRRSLDPNFFRVGGNFLLIDSMGTTSAGEPMFYLPTAGDVAAGLQRTPEPTPVPPPRSPSERVRPWELAPVRVENVGVAPSGVAAATQANRRGKGKARPPMKTGGRQTKDHQTTMTKRASPRKKPRRTKRK